MNLMQNQDSFTCCNFSIKITHEWSGQYRRFIKRNKIISLFGFIASFISISYAITYNIPDYFGIESWYALFNNISISYIAALIFYVLQVYKPEYDNSKKSKIILLPLFEDLTKYLEIVIACCRKYVSIGEMGKIEILWDDKEKRIIYFVPKLKSADKEQTRPAVKRDRDDLLESDVIFRAKIKKIKERIDFRWCDQNILDTLSELESTSFLNGTLKSVLNYENTFIGCPEFLEYVNKFEELKNNLKNAVK